MCKGVYLILFRLALIPLEIVTFIFGKGVHTFPAEIKGQKLQQAVTQVSHFFFFFSYTLRVILLSF